MGWICVPQGSPQGKIGRAGLGEPLIFSENTIMWFALYFWIPNSHKTVTRS